MRTSRWARLGCALASLAMTSPLAQAEDEEPLYATATVLPVALVTNEFQVTMSSADETTPTLGNDGTSDLVVYTMNIILPDGDRAPGQIWYQRIGDSGPFGPAVQVTTGETDDQLNDVSGKYIVYTAYDSITSTSGVITLCSIDNPYECVPLARAEVAREPRIHGGNVVWGQGASGASQIMLYKLEWLGTAQQALVIAGPVPPAEQVAIGETYVAWAQYDFDDRQFDIWAFDLVNTVRLQVTVTPSISETQPATSGPWVVWQAPRTGSTAVTIEAQDPRSLESRLVANNGAANYRPDIDGDLIAWESTVTGNLDIFVYRLSTGQTFQVTTDLADEYLNDVFGNKVAYVDLRNGSEDVYVSTLAFVSFSPSSYDFGKVVAFTTASTCVNVTNVSASPVRILPSLPAGSTPPFSVDLVPAPAGYPVLPAETFCVPIVFAPTDVPESPWTTELTITAGSPPRTVATVPIQGTGIPGFGELSVAPESLSLSLGDVELGSSAADIVTISNDSLHWSSTVVADLLGNSSPAFSFSCAAPTLCTCTSGVCQFQVAPLSTVDLDVVFAPQVLGSATATLALNVTDQSNQAWLVSLTGTGVHAPTPSELVADLLGLFDESVANGSLAGSGPGNSATGRLKALRNMIKAAGDLIAQGQYARACQQLLDAYERVDGLAPPPDFAAGTAAAEIRARIGAIRGSIGCS